MRQARVIIIGGGHVVGGFFVAQSRARMKEFKFLAGKFKALNLPYELVTPADIRESMTAWKAWVEG